MFKLLDLSICLSIYLSIYLIFTSTCFLLLLQLSNPSSVLLPAPSFLIIFSECLCESFQTPLSINMFLPPPPPQSTSICILYPSGLPPNLCPSSFVWSFGVLLDDNPVPIIQLLSPPLHPPLLRLKWCYMTIQYPPASASCYSPFFLLCFFFSSPHIFVFPTFTPPLHLFSV